MESYYFVGAFSEVGSVRLETFGQIIKLAEKDAREAVRGGCALVPEDEFKAIGFESDELKAYRQPVTHYRPGVPASFLEKKAKALKASKDFLKGKPKAKAPEPKPILSPATPKAKE